MKQFRYSYTVHPHENAEPQFSQLARLLLATRRFGSVHEARLPVILYQDLVNNEYTMQYYPLAASEGAAGLKSSDGYCFCQDMLGATRELLDQCEPLLETFAQDDAEQPNEELLSREARAKQASPASVRSFVIPSTGECERDAALDQLASQEYAQKSRYGSVQRIIASLAGSGNKERCYCEVRDDPANHNSAGESEEQQDNLLILRTSPPKREPAGQMVICAPTSALCTSVFYAKKQITGAEYAKVGDSQVKSQISSSLPAVYNHGTQYGLQHETSDYSFGVYTYADDDFMVAVRAVLRGARASQRYVFGEKPGFW